MTEPTAERVFERGVQGGGVAADGFAVPGLHGAHAGGGSDVRLPRRPAIDVGEDLPDHRRWRGDRDVFGDDDGGVALDLHRSIVSDGRGFSNPASRVVGYTS